MDYNTVRACSEELQKIAKTRYEKEIARGAISRSELGEGLGRHELPSILGMGQRKRTREALAAPAAVSEGALSQKRRMAGKLYEAQAKVTPDVQRTMGFMMGPASAGSTILAGPESGAFMRHAASGGLGPYRAVGGTLTGPGVSGMGANPLPIPPKAMSVLERVSRAALGKSSPEDATLTHSILRHEMGERAAGAKPVLPVASHFGPRPILEEQLALKGDPAAQKVMSKARQMHPDDALMQKLIRQAGGTPDSPLPTGGKHERALEKMLSRRVKELQPATRQKAFLMSGVKDVGYLPQELHLSSLAESGGELAKSVKGKGYRRALGQARELLGRGIRAGKFLKGS